MKQLIEQLISDGITKLQNDGRWGEFKVPDIIVERPKERGHGDWTTNIEQGNSAKNLPVNKSVIKRVICL